MFAGQVGGVAIGRSLGRGRVTEEERRFVVVERCASLKGIVVRGLKPPAGVTTLTRAVLVGVELWRDTGRVGLVARNVRRALRRRLAVKHAFGRRTMAQRDGSMWWWATRMGPGHFPRYSSWEVVHGCDCYIGNVGL